MRIGMWIGFDLCRAPWATRPLALARGLVEAGHDVRLLHYPLASGGEPMHDPAEWGLAPVALDKRRPFACLRQATDCVAWCDLLHVQKPVTANGLLLRTAWRGQKPLVYDWDDWEGRGGIASLFYSKRRAWRTNWNERYLARRADLILYANDTIARELARAWKRAERTAFAPCGVDPLHFDPGRFDAEHRRRLREALGLHPGPLVVYHGQLDLDSEQDLLLQVLYRLRADMPVSFLVLGGGRQQDRLQGRASALKLGGAVRYAGYVPYREVPAYLALADVAMVLLPDALFAHCKSPLKVYEAMAMGLPVVGNRVGQVETLLESGRGVLCSPGHPEQVETALRDLLTDKDRARAIGQRARAYILDGRTWEAVVKRLLAAYNAVVAPPGDVGALHAPL